MAASARGLVRRIGFALGIVWALPLSVPMLLMGLLVVPFGARLRRQGLAVVVTRFPFGPPAALALGNVVITQLPGLGVRVPSYRSRAASAARAAVPWRDERVHLGRHELAHVRQAMVLGVFFPVVYLLYGGVSARNPFERAADRYARSGRGWWPFNVVAARS